MADGTGAAFLASNAGRVLAGETLDDEITVRFWVEVTSRAKAREQVVDLGRYGTTLTILSSGAIGQEHLVDEDDEALVKSWKPQFKL